MSYSEIKAKIDYWSDTLESAATNRGKYIAVSGNTGSGKSTLVNALTEHFNENNTFRRTIGINERLLHHPLLRLMFAKPHQFAFGVQLNFLLQRYMVLLRWLMTGVTVVMERSHLDDALFIRHHYRKGHIGAEQLAAYENLAEVLHKDIPYPDVFICLSASADVSMERINADEEKGERPKEFPSEAVKRDFVNSWAKRYAEYHRTIKARYLEFDKLKSKICLEFSAELDIGFIIQEITRILSKPE